MRCGAVDDDAVAVEVVLQKTGELVEVRLGANVNLRAAAHTRIRVHCLVQRGKL